jgi:hypothetical protein
MFDRNTQTDGEPNFTLTQVALDDTLREPAQRVVDRLKELCGIGSDLALQRRSATS